MIIYSGTSMRDRTYMYKDVKSPACMADEWGEVDRQRMCEKLFKGVWRS